MPFVLLLAGMTSLGAYALGSRWLGLSGRHLPGAAGKMLECAGLTVAFLAANLALGVSSILAVRAATHSFPSLYVPDDVALLVLSLLQALTFQWWRTGPRPPDEGAGPTDRRPPRGTAKA